MNGLAAKGVEHDIRALEPWFHNLHLPTGEQTCPNHFLGDFPLVNWRLLGRLLPDRMDGWSVLDIGCNAGFYSIELARRGARVTAIDSDPHYLTQARWARSQYGLESLISLRRQDVYELGGSSERYDLVLFLGVFYHLRYPLLALDIVSDLVGRLMLFQSLSMPPETEEEPVPDDLPLTDRARLSAPGWPRMAFIERKLNDDPTNWWVPNQACVEAMLRSSGMRVVARPMQEFYLCEPRKGE